MKQPIPQNVLWITTDHMRYDCIHAHENPVMHTPTLDYLVNHGISFNQCYTQSPICMASRASFMTGLYPQQTGVTENGFILPPDFPWTPARLFARGNYRTAQIGKLHFDSHHDYDLDPRKKEAYGFDTFWLSEESGMYEDAYVKWLRSEYPDYVNMFRTPRFTTKDGFPDVRKVQVLDAPFRASQSGWIASQASFYFQGREGKQFVHLGFYAPHPPLKPTREVFSHYEGMDIPAPCQIPREWDQKPDPYHLSSICKDWQPEDFIEYRRHFYAFVSEVDKAIGQVMDQLDTLGMLQNTLIAFTSDHGDMCGDHSMVCKGPSFLDEIMHVPCILYWSNGLGTKARRIQGLMELLDLYPTILELCAIPIPEVLTGCSYAKDLLEGKAPKMREDVLAFNHPDWAMLRNEKFKYIRYNSLGQDILYDLDESPKEVRNHSNDPAYTVVLQQIRERMLTRVLAASRSPLVNTNRA